MVIIHNRIDTSTKGSLELTVGKHSDIGWYFLICEPISVQGRNSRQMPEIEIDYTVSTSEMNFIVQKQGLLQRIQLLLN